jgi:copper chaperone CopZ
MPTTSFHVHGMDCTWEVGAIKAELARREDLSFDALSGRMTARYDEAKVRPEQIATAIARTGMRASEWHDVKGLPALLRPGRADSQSPRRTIRR